MSYKHPPESKPLPGYTIKRGVGRGAFGEVYYAVSDGGKEVALKLVQNHVEVELRGVRECLNFDHANLVSLYDVQQNDAGEFWVVMEYCDGESLEEAIARYPKGMPIDVALQWMRGICAGVGYLHDQDVVHRDLKPSHVFLEDGVIKIGDYGLAKFVSLSKRSGNTEGIGTVYYAAPEMAQGRYGKEIDQYALGVMFFEMLSGDVPFEGETAAEVLMKHLTAKPEVSRFPSPYREIVRKLLEKKPERRYQSVAELLADLDAPVTASAGSSPGNWLICRAAKFKESANLKQAVRRSFEFIRQHKFATCVFCGLIIASFAIGAAIMEEAWRARYYRGGYRRPQAVSVERLSDLRVKRGDRNETVRLWEVATFTAPRDVQHLSHRRPVYEVILRDSAAKVVGVDRDSVMEAAWDAGYSVIIDFELKSRVNGIDRDDVRQKLLDLCRSNNHRRNQCRIVRHAQHVGIQVSQNRRSRTPQPATDYFAMNLQELFDVSIQKDGRIVPLKDVADIRILISSPF